MGFTSGGGSSIIVTPMPYADQGTVPAAHLASGIGRGPNGNVKANTRMIEEQQGDEPDWDSPLQFTLTPGLLIHALMATATAVHTGWESCIEEGLVVSDVVAMDDGAGTSIRLAEQEFYEDNNPDNVWHDWALEVRNGKVLTTAHWQILTTATPAEWAWHGREAEKAFERACVLLGKRVRRGLVVEEPMPMDAPPRASRH